MTSKEEWEKAVREARSYVNNYDKVRWKICDIALRVCDIKKGGRVSSSAFTLTKFADAIELNPKTLMTWVSIKKKVIEKLPATELKDKSTYTFDDILRVSNQITEKATKAEVLRLWKQQLLIPRETKKFLKYIRALDSILYNAQRPLKMTEIPEHNIKDIISKCSVIANLLNKELELRKRFSIEDRIKEKHQDYELALKEVEDIL